MFEYNFTAEIQFQQLRQDNQNFRRENDQYKKDIQDLNDNIETLLQYNSQLLAVIQDINRQSSKQPNNHDQNVIHQQCYNQIRNLRERIQQYQENQLKYKEQFKRIKNQMPATKDKKQAGSGQVIKLVQQCYKNNQAMQKKFQQRFDNLFKQINDLRGTSKSTIDKFQSVLQERQLKIQDIFDQFEKKDEIVELMGQKVKILQQYYVNSKSETIQRMIQTDNSLQSTEQSKKTNILNEEIQEYNRKLQQKNKVIKIYQQLIDKLRKKVSQKYFS